MQLYIHDTKTRQKRLFEPLDADSVSIYLCGPTVYSRIHIGNGLSAVVFDVFVRLLRVLYKDVKFVRNVTDIDDKINRAAAEAGESIRDLSQRYVQAMEEDYAALHVLPPDVQPLATDHVDEIIELIERLVIRGFAYESAGHVLFEVQTDPHYGSLANRSLRDMLDGARVEVAPYKRDPKDFVLWKPSTPELPGWDSPWGRGRPGWHIECTAMIRKHLAATIDIHAGGSDLVFPHHENEKAQGTCLEDEGKYVRYWMHNGMLAMPDGKMSKSVGNIRTVEELTKEYSGEVLRYALLSGHYRQSLLWHDELIEQARRSVDSIYTAMRKTIRATQTQPATADFRSKRVDDFPEPVLEALCDDLNTPRALAAIHQIVSRINRTDDTRELRLLQHELTGSSWLLGIMNSSVDEYFKGLPTQKPEEASSVDLSPLKIQQLIDERSAARSAKNYAKADEIRNYLHQRGISLEDSAAGTEWRRT